MDDWQCEDCSIPNKAGAWFCKECRRPRKKTAGHKEVSGGSHFLGCEEVTDYLPLVWGGCQLLAAGRWFSPGIPASSTIKIGGATSYEFCTDSDYISSLREKDGKRQSGRHGNAQHGLAAEGRTVVQEEFSTKSSDCLKPRKQKAREVQHHPNYSLPDDFTFDGISHNERRIVLIGKTGSGKSATGNTILGISDAFESKLSGKSITKHCQRREAERFGKKLMVVDTPGMFDTSMSNEHIKEEIGKCIGITSPGPHAIILVVQINRFTEEEQKTVDLFVERFGEGMYRHLIVLFTRKDDLVKMNTSISAYVKGTEQLDSILQRCQDRYIAFDNFSPSKDKDVQYLLNMIEDIIQKNKGKCYTNTMFIEAEKAMKRRMAVIREEERKKKEKELKEHTDKIAKSYEAEINAQKHEKMKQQKEIERLESQRQKELEIQQQQEEDNRRLKKEKEKLEKQRQKDARDFEVTRKKLEEQNQKEKAARKKREKELEKTRNRKEMEKLEKKIEAHERYMSEAAEKEEQLKIEKQKEQERKRAEIEKKYEREHRRKTRDEVEERGFLGTVWDFITFKWLRNEEPPSGCLRHEV